MDKNTRFMRNKNMLDTTPRKPVEIMSNSLIFL